MAASAVSKLLPSSISGLALALPFLLLGYTISLYLYNIFFHILRKWPGPMLCAATPLPLIYQSLKGNQVTWIVKLHGQYGEVVRISPNELSFSSADAYKDIYGHKKTGLPALEKDPMFYRSPLGETDIVNAGFHDHARMRRIFSNAFSDRALKLQEPLFNKYVDRLIEKIREGNREDPEKTWNMVKMYNFTTFDVMGDLAFGEPLDLLNSTAFHPWIDAMFAGFKFGTYLHAMRYFPGVEGFLLNYCIPESIRVKMRLHKEFSAQRVNRRIEKQDARPDIWGLVLGRDETSGLDKEEMYSNSNLFMLAGTETTATLLSGLTYYLLTTPEKLGKLIREVRTTFRSEEEITIEKLQSLKYLNACVEEGLRMYPPVSAGMPRLTPVGSPTTIDGHKVPAGARVFVTTLAANRNPENWRDPYNFVPERWLPDAPEASIYAGDKKYGLQPFSLGPRGCLGKNMAYHEMRLILTKVLYSFDVELCPESRNWSEQLIFIMWDKPELRCRLTPAQKS